MEMENNRHDMRLMSSLKDLRLGTVKKTLENIDDGKRKTKRFCPIRRGYQDREIYENFISKTKNKTFSDKELIMKSLSSHFIFSSLIEDRKAQEILLQKFSFCQVKEGEYLMKQSDNASSFFILHEGKLSVQINNQVKRYIKAGEGFGQLALLYSAPRSASIKAEKCSYLWYIDRSTFRKLVETIIEKNFSQNRRFIEHNKFFTYLTDRQKDKIASIGINAKFQKGQKICKEGELASSMFILKTGKLRRSVDGVQIGVLSPGDSFQQYATLSKNNNRRQTITTLEDSQLIALAAEDIQNALGKSLPIIILRNRAMSALMSSKTFNKLQTRLLDKIIDKFQIKKLPEHGKIVKKGDLCREHIFFIIEGICDKKRKSDNCMLFGEQCALQQTHQAKYDVDISFKNEGKIAFVTKEQIEEALGFTIDVAIKKSEQMKFIMKRHRQGKQQIKVQTKSMTIGDFFVLKKLGQGQFGQVFLVTDKNKSNIYALKCISKYQTVKCKLEKHLLNQKNVLEQIDSPFAVDYIRSFKDQHYIYFLTEFINGMELFDAIRIIGILNVAQCQFYTAILLHVLESLHQSCIVYRDLKPENVMVGVDGYLKLIDMGTCKYINPKAVVQKTFTIIGTPNYMAPQILAGKGYSYSVDLWSLGVVLYEFMAGYVPFGQQAEDPYQIYEEILKNPLKFPKHMTDKNTNAFITQILNKNSEARLGGSYSVLKNHPFFQGIDWNALTDKKVKPPFMLPSNKLIDVKKLNQDIKPLNKLLKVPSKPIPARKDLNPNWDETF